LTALALSKLPDFLNVFFLKPDVTDLGSPLPLPMDVAFSGAFA